MYDIKLLEAQWKKYQRKKRRPLYIFSVLILVLLAAAVSVLNYRENEIFNIDFDLNVTNPLENNKPKAAYNFLLDTPITVLEVKTKVVLESNDSDEPFTDERTEDFPLNENKVRGNKPKINIEVIDTNSVSVYADVASRFHQSHDTDDSLFLAKSYYNRGNYEKAEYWALQTNKVNVNIEESWIIFSKAKVKQGKKKEAIRILKTYINRTNSVAANKLLYKIEKGTL